MVSFFQKFVICLHIVIIIIMSYHHHGYPWPSVAISPYHSSPLAGLEGYIPYPHIAAVCIFELVVMLLLGHMRGSIGVHCWRSKDELISDVLAHSINVKQFKFTHRWESVRCFLCGSEFTRQQWQWRDSSHSPKHQDWNLAIVLINVISRKLIQEVLPPLKRCSRCILQPDRLN